MALSEYVQVTIQAGTATPTQAGFGTLLILSNGTGSVGAGLDTNTVYTYRTFSALASDFDSSDFPYLAGLAAFSQNPRPQSVKVGLLPTPSSFQQIQISLDNVASGSAITGSLVSPAGSGSVILADPGASTSDLAQNLSDAIGAFTGISASSAGNVVTTTAGTEGEMWHFTDDLNGISILDITADLDYDDQLDNLITVDSDFYAVVIDNNSAKNIDKVARWAAANNKIAFFSPQLTRPADWDSSLFTATADYTALLANDNAVLLPTKDARTNAKEVAWAASQLVEDPGTITWAFKTLEGIGADSYTSTEETLIKGSTIGGNVYKTVAGISITDPGKTCGGEFIDVVRAIDWMQARMEENIFALLANNPKVPYTDKGANMVLAEVKAVLVQAERREVIDSGWTATVLPVAQQATADRANRVLREVEFQARLAGAIHTITVTGTVTV